VIRLYDAAGNVIGARPPAIGDTAAVEDGSRPFNIHQIPEKHRLAFEQVETLAGKPAAGGENHSFTQTERMGPWSHIQSGGDFRH
jgi:hypothetical protein